VSGIVEGLSLDDTVWELAIREEAKTEYKSIQIGVCEMKTAINAADEDAYLIAEAEMEDYLLNKLPFHISATLQGVEVMRLVVTFNDDNNNDMELIL
jgi:hypothetical protein